MMTDRANAAATKSDEQNAGLIRIERENATVQCVFGNTLQKLPYQEYPLSAVAELPYGRGKQMVLEGRAGAFLDLATWAGGIGGRIAVASGVFTEISVRERRRIDRLVQKWEKQSREAALARATAATGEARRVKKFLGAIAELGRGRIEEAVAGLEAAVK